MKPLILVLATVICLPAFAAEPVITATPASESKAAPPVVTTFCGQDAVQRWFLKTEVGKQLQLRQQEAQREALRQAMLQAVNEGKISVQEYMQLIETKLIAPALPLSKAIPQE